MAVAAVFDSELGAFVDEICADLCRFECAAAAGCAPSDVRVECEVPLAPDIHADIRVEPPGGEPAPDASYRGLFQPLPPIEAKNVGVIQGWRTTGDALQAVRNRA